jgi:hypothetical protein
MKRSDYSKFEVLFTEQVIELVFKWQQTNSIIAIAISWILVLVVFTIMACSAIC